MRALRLAALGITTVALAGCGGSSINNTNITSAGNSPSGPVIYGLNPTYALNGVGTLETSGLGAGDGSAIYLTGATGYKVVSGNGPIAVVASNFNNSIPTGFPGGGAYLNGKTGLAAPTTGQVAFGVYIQQGALPSGGTLVNVDIDPNQEVLTSPEAPGFQQKFNFTGVTNNALSNSTYQTAPFTLPAPLNTTGLHSFTASVGDVQGQKSQTTFDVVVVAPTDVALFAQSIDTGTKDKNGKEVIYTIAQGDTAAISNPVAGARQQTTADAQGTVVLFTTPSTGTILTVNGKDANGNAVTYNQTIDTSKAAGTAVIQ